MENIKDNLCILDDQTHSFQGTVVNRTQSLYKSTIEKWCTGGALSVINKQTLMYNKTIFNKNFILM